MIDFTFVDERGRQRRYRRDAHVQSAAGARAEAARLQMMAVQTGTLEPKKQVPTLAAFARGQFNELFMGKYRPSTRKRYEGMLPLLISELGSRRLDEIGARDARALAAELTLRGIGTKPHVNLLKTILRAAHEVGVIEELPKLPRLHRESRKLPDCPSRAEVDRMLVGARGWLRVAVALAAYAGLRMGEVRALEVRDVDLDVGVIAVRRSVSEDQVMSPKSGHERVIPVAEALRSGMSKKRRDYWIADIDNGALRDLRELDAIRRRDHISREAIAQHYGGATRALDLTMNLGAALTFSVFDAWERDGEFGYIHVYLLPRADTALAFHASAGAVVVDLRATLPSYALRPHCQQAFLLMLLSDASAPAACSTSSRVQHDLTFLRYVTLKLPVEVWKEPRHLALSGLPGCPRRALSAVYRRPESKGDPLVGDRILAGFREKIDHDLLSSYDSPASCKVHGCASRRLGSLWRACAARVCQWIRR